MPNKSRSKDDKNRMPALGRHNPRMRYGDVRSPDDINTDTEDMKEEPFERGEDGSDSE